MSLQVVQNIMESNHDLSQLISWYQRYADTDVPADHDPIQDFNELKDLAARLNLLQDCFTEPGPVSVIRPANAQPDLSTIHQAIATSSNATYSLRFLFNHAVRKFYTNFSPEEVGQISSKKKAKVTQMELLVVINRMWHCQKIGKDYPYIFEEDLPYRSAPWVLSLIECLEINYMSRMTMTEYRALNNLVGRVLSVIDAHEEKLEKDEAIFLSNLGV